MKIKYKSENGIEETFFYLEKQSDTYQDGTTSIDYIVKNAVFFINQQLNESKIEKGEVVKLPLRCSLFLAKHFIINGCKWNLICDPLGNPMIFN